MKDLFSTGSKEYYQYRPSYPENLYAFILNLTAHHDHAWDAGTGNGQVASVLSRHFSRIQATDISKEQLAQAEVHHNITYQCAAAENTQLPDHSMDLITTAQAIHWFNIPTFEKEVRRVLKPDGVFCYWGYALPSISDSDWNRIFTEFYENETDAFWEPERQYVDNHYRNLPFTSIKATHKPFIMELYWSSEQLIGYMSTWSALKKMISVTGKNPLIPFHKRHQDFPARFFVRFPVFLYYWVNS